MAGIKRIFKRICVACGKEFTYKCSFKGDYYCYKHYNQIRNYGKVLDNNPRGKYDRNNYKIIGDKVVVDTYNKLNEKK